MASQNATLEYMSFYLIDPQLVIRGDVATATAMTIGALCRKSYQEILELGAKERVAALDRGLTAIEHDAKRRSILGRRPGITASYSLYYCSLCGSKFTPGHCPRCKISMGILKTSGIVGQFPDIPPKIVKHAERHGHQFMSVPPRP